jgi:hypothetical protein
MNNDLRLRVADYFEEEWFIEYVHDRWLNAHIAKQLCLLWRTGRANNRPTIINQQPTEPAPDGPTRSCNKDISIRFCIHLSFSFLSMSVLAGAFAIS